MKKTTLPFAQVPQLSKTDIAYATGAKALLPFYAYAPTLESFHQIIQEKQGRTYPRKDLADQLEKQYIQLPLKGKVSGNIQALRSETTFTIATAHQPSLFLGPLYFIYKALTVINLAHSLESNTPGCRIVPVFVLGSEDHDLEELNHVTLFGKKLVWEPGMQGAVGSIPANSLIPALEALKQVLGESAQAQALFERVERAYVGEKDFATGTQALLHEFLGDMGLVVLNMNSPELKRHFIPVMREELLEQRAFKLVNQTISQLNAAGFKTQAAPREINLFYMLPGSRERITQEGNRFKVLNTELSFSQGEILSELESHPERFSPNVVLRPLFQEIVLPNLAYVGGGGELAYWLERKSLFEHFQVQFPMLVRRHSVLWLDVDTMKKMEKLGLSAEALFEDSDALVRDFIARNAEVKVDLISETNALRALYDQLTLKAAAIDPTLEKAVRAEEVKALSGLQQWESRLMRAEKQKHEVSISQLRALKEKFFPANGLQERSDNLLPYVLKYGDDFIKELHDNLQPFEPGFIVLQAELPVQ